MSCSFPRKRRFSNSILSFICFIFVLPRGVPHWEGGYRLFATVLWVGASGSGGDAAVWPSSRLGCSAIFRVPSCGLKATAIFGCSRFWPAEQWLAWPAPISGRFAASVCAPHAPLVVRGKYCLLDHNWLSSRYPFWKQFINNNAELDFRVGWQRSVRELLDGSAWPVWTRFPTFQQ